MHNTTKTTSGPKESGRLQVKVQQRNVPDTAAKGKKNILSGKRKKSITQIGRALRSAHLSKAQQIPSIRTAGSVPVDLHPGLMGSSSDSSSSCSRDSAQLNKKSSGNPNKKGVCKGKYKWRCGRRWRFRWGRGVWRS